MATPPAAAPVPPAPSVERFCARVLACGDLATKLAPPVDAAGGALVDAPSGSAPPPPNRPARDPGLRMGSGSDALPPPGALGEPEARRRCLARFAHHELQAVEYFAWALLRWPDAPAALRRGLLGALVDEQRHCRLYLDRLAALGGRFESDDHSDYFWRQVDAIEAAPDGLAAFLAAMGLTLEQANLDFTLTYRDAFAAAGDAETAAICQTVHDDEVAHVALAHRWLRRLAPAPPPGEPEPDDLARYLEAVPFPLGAARAKGRRFEAAPRRRAGLSDAFVEHVRHARGGRDGDRPPTRLIANLGGEEEPARDPALVQPEVRTAARLWSLLFAWPVRFDAAAAEPLRWPAALGRPAASAAFTFLDVETDDERVGDHERRGGHEREGDDAVRSRARGRGAVFGWLIDEAARARAERLGAPLEGPAPERVRAVHDKAFAVEAARALGLTPRALAPLIEVFEPEALADPSRAIPTIEAAVTAWPAWTGGRFALKPRFGSSGRGRFGGALPLDEARLRGALPRLVARGGAVLEPWLDRVGDRSTTLFVPPGEAADASIVVLGSLGQWTSPGGVPRGHFGEIDSRGRVFSGDPEDESLRADAAAIAAQARALGFSGPCGVDAFRYREGDDGRERLRPVVEFNARATMGLVTLGLVRRAWPRVRKRLAISPGERHGFALVLRDAGAEDWRPRIHRALDGRAVIVDLGDASLAGDPRAHLVFARDPEALRAAGREGLGGER